MVEIIKRSADEALEGGVPTEASDDTPEGGVPTETSDDMAEVKKEKVEDTIEVEKTGE